VLHRELVGLGIDGGLPLGVTGLRTRCDLDTTTRRGQAFTDAIHSRLHRTGPQSRLSPDCTCPQWVFTAQRSGGVVGSTHAV
jgi:hypothetical protein